MTVVNLVEGATAECCIMPPAFPTIFHTEKVVWSCTNVYIAH